MGDGDQRRRSQDVGSRRSSAASLGRSRTSVAPLLETVLPPHVRSALLFFQRCPRKTDMCAFELGMRLGRSACSWHPLRTLTKIKPSFTSNTNLALHSKPEQPFNRALPPSSRKGICSKNSSVFYALARSSALVTALALAHPLWCKFAIISWWLPFLWAAPLWGGPWDRGPPVDTFRCYVRQLPSYGQAVEISDDSPGQCFFGRDFGYF